MSSYIPSYVNAKIESTLRKLQDTLNSKIKVVGGGAKFFMNNNKRGEGAELQADLNSNDKERQKNAVKRIIANMTLGKDVSQLFVEVVKLGQTLNIGLKKLVYLYVLNTAKLQEDKALMAVNTFLIDATHQSPIVRSLAIRTMMSIRVECVMEYTLEPLRRALADKEPYVRKTAAMALGKLFHQNPRLFHEQGFLQELSALLNDTVPMVASNAAIIFAEVASVTPRPETVVTHAMVTKLLGYLPDSTEWGQTYILEFIAHYTPHSQEEAETIVERVVPRLSHNNPAVVLGAIKVISMALQKCSAELQATHNHRINSAVLTLAKTDPETQYVVLKNIHLLLALYPHMLMSNLDAFFIRFTDPAYVKFEKLKLLLKLMTQKTAAQVMGELTEYSNEVDVVFVREVVHAIASAIIKVDVIVPNGIKLLLHIASKRPELHADIVNASKNIVRKYPEVFLDLVCPLIKEYAVDSIDDEEGKVSFVWMLGEFCDLIEDGHELLQRYISCFHEQEVAVQLSLLTAVVKVFLRNPSGVESTLNKVLEMATKESDSPDLRDRAWMYWRLLAEGIGVDKMKQIVHGKKVDIQVDRSITETLTISEVRHCLNTCAAVYAKPSRSFLPPYGAWAEGMEEEEDDEEDVMESPTQPNAPQQFTPAATQPQQQNTTARPGIAHVDPLDSIFSSGAPQSSGATTQKQNAPVDPFDSMFGPTPTAAPPQSASSTVKLPPLVVDPTQGNGVMVHAEFIMDDVPMIDLVIQNSGAIVLTDFVMKFNKNTYGFLPDKDLNQLIPNGALQPGQQVAAKIPLRSAESHFEGPKFAVQVGLKCSVGLCTFFLTPPSSKQLVTSPPMTAAEFATQWKALDKSLETHINLSAALAAKFNSSSASEITSLLGQNRVYVVVHRPVQGTDNFFGCFKTHTGITSLFELVLTRQANPTAALSVKSQRGDEMTPILQHCLEAIVERW